MSKIARMKAAAASARRREREKGERFLDASVGRAAQYAGGFASGRFLHGRKLGPIPLSFALGGAATILELMGVGEKSLFVRAGYDAAHGAATGEAAIQGLLLAEGAEDGA